MEHLMSDLRSETKLWLWLCLFKNMVAPIDGAKFKLLLIEPSLETP
jgi:hypothetical protein